MSLLADGTIFHNNRLAEVHPCCGLGRLRLQRIQSRFQMPLTEVQPRMLTASPRRRPPVQGIQEQICHVLQGEGLMEIAGSARNGTPRCVSTIKAEPLCSSHLHNGPA